MEEQVGALWHRLITRVAARGHASAAVRLDEIAPAAGLLFRALGGDGGLTIASADAAAHGARRSLLQRIAGSGERTALAWRDERALRLPPVIDSFAERALNRDLYLWLAALAAQDPSGAPADWLARNQTLTARALARFPGLAPRYRRLADAHLAQRPEPRRLPAGEAAREAAVRQALLHPQHPATLPPGRRPPYPVPLWLHPDPPLPAGAGAAPGADGDPERGDGPAADLGARRRRRGERIETPRGDRGLVTVRMENILTWGEHVPVDRSTDEEDDPERARAAAEDMERISVARDRRAAGARLKFDLDLPAESEDDLVLDDGILVPEWDWRRRTLRPGHCRIQSLIAADAAPRPLPPHLAATAQRLRARFQALAPGRVWQRGRPDGQEPDLDAWLRLASDRRAGTGTGSPADGLYRRLDPGGRDLACLLLADLSLSTDAWVDDRLRVIDIIRDGLHLFAESLAACGDRFALYGFSSRRRDPVRVHRLKGFAEPHGPAVRGRIQAIRPGYYTRMGAAIRHATDLLAAQTAGRRLLLILSDGKPNDLDHYEGRWGIEDTRHAVRSARGMGREPFCITVDAGGNDYLPHLFGAGGYVVIRRPADLPSRLPVLYARLTGRARAC